MRTSPQTSVGFLPFARALRTRAPGPRLVQAAAARVAPPTITTSACLSALRELGRNAEARRLEALAFELFFAAARIEATGQTAFVRGQLEHIATFVPETEARVYRRAARLLASISDAQP